MKKIFGILLFAALLALSVFAVETVNLANFPDESTIISSPKYEGITYPVEYANGIYGTKAQIAADMPSGRAFTDEEKAEIADIGYGVSAIGVRNFGAANAIRNLVDGCWNGSKMAYMRFDDNMYDVDGTVNENGKYRALITLNFSTEYRFDACGFISGTQAGMVNAADIYVSDDGVNWTLVPSASWDASDDSALVNLVSGNVKTPADRWTSYADSPFATLFDMDGVSGQYIRIGVIKGRGGSSDPNTLNTREFLVYGEQTGEDNPASRTDVLFIGNSFTYVSDMPERFFMPISRSAGYNVYATRITNGGHYLYEHGNINDEFGAQVYYALDNNTYDFVVIQEQSSNAIKNPESFYTAVRRLVNLIRENGATPILYSTWGHREGSSTLEGMPGWDTESMTYGLAAAYNAISEELGVDRSEVGLAFWDVHSKHASTIDLYISDNYHQSALGAYLSGMTHFANIVGGNPLNCTYNEDFAESTTAILKQAAYDATYNTPAIPDKYKTSSVGVGTDGLFGIDASKTVVLSEYPDYPMISVVKKDGTFSGITGDKGVVASAEYSATGLTAAQKADIADIGYGVSMKGIEYMLESASGYKKAVANLVNGHWGTSLMSSFEFGSDRYDIDGTVNKNGKYRALYTLNFGSEHKFEAIGFFSGNAFGIASAADVYVSDDGVNWTIVPTACYDGINHTAYTNLGPTPKDPYNGNTAAYAVLFGMDGVTGKYIRLGIAVGRSNTYENYNNINTRELVVYGTKYPLGDVDADGVTTLHEVMNAIKLSINGGLYHTYMDTNGDETITLLDALRIFKATVE